MIGQEGEPLVDLGNKLVINAIVLHGAADAANDGAGRQSTNWAAQQKAGCQAETGAAIVPATAAPRQVDGRFSRIIVPELPRRVVAFARRRRPAPSAATSAVAEVLAEALQAVAILLTDQNLAQSRALIPAPDYRLPDIPSRRQAGPDEDYQRYALTADGVSPMAIPGTPCSTYVADGLEHTETGKPSTAAADQAAELDKRAGKLENFD